MKTASGRSVAKLRQLCRRRQQQRRLSVATEDPMTAEDVVRYDRETIWHPYSSLPSAVPCFPVAGADGSCITLLPDGKSSEGRRLVDGMSSWWSAIHGYNHPVLNRAAQRQIDRVSHVMFGGLTHEPAVRLSRTLRKMTPAGLDRVFYCDSGSVAIEVAMKMALQYHRITRGHDRRSKFLTVAGGYHGDTFHAMSVCDPVNGMHRMFPRLAQQIFAPRPHVRYHEQWQDDSDDPSLAAFHRLLEQHSDEIAAIVVEPVVQGAGGMRFYHPNYLRRYREAADAHGVLLIADEIATGFGRAGRHLFACQHAGVVPDILCIGKALSGGFLSFAAAVTAKHLSDVFAETNSVLMHGPTFMGNPLACAVSDANLQLLQSYDWRTTIADIETQLQRELEPAKDSPYVADVRVLGAIGVIEMKKPIDMSVVQPSIVNDYGVWLRPFGKLLYTMPPYIITQEELQKVTHAMVSIAHTPPT